MLTSEFAELVRSLCERLEDIMGCFLSTESSKKSNIETDRKENIFLEPLVVSDGIIDWDQIKFNPADKSPLIGKGSFGVVFKGILESKGENNEDVKSRIAVKVVVRNRQVTSDADFAAICKSARGEFEVMKKAQDVFMNSVYGDCTIRAYGVVEGTLPAILCKLFNIQAGCTAVGIVMRYEEGGSLGSKLYSRRCVRR